MNLNLMEFVIIDYHFTRCTNLHCKSIFALKIEDVNVDSEQFCPKCKAAMQDSHIVQCANCQAILNIIPKFPNEDDIVFYVDKCSHCSGTIKDEKRLSPNYYPESFV